MCVFFIKLHITAQSSPVCVCVFIKLHVTAQSGPVILAILCHPHCSSQGGINDTCYENLWSGATEGTHSLYLYNSYLSPEYLVLPPLLPCCSLDYLGWQLLNQPFFSTFFLFPPVCLPFPLSSSPFPYPLLSPLPSPLPSPFASYVRLRVPNPVLVPAPSPLPFPFPSCAPSFTSTPVPVPAPPPSP